MYAGEQAKAGAGLVGRRRVRARAVHALEEAALVHERRPAVLEARVARREPEVHELRRRREVRRRRGRAVQRGAALCRRCGRVRRVRVGLDGRVEVRGRVWRLLLWLLWLLLLLLLLHRWVGRVEARDGRRGVGLPGIRQRMLLGVNRWPLGEGRGRGVVRAVSLRRRGLICLGRVSLGADGDALGLQPFWI